MIAETKKPKLVDFIAYLQRNGRYTFAKNEAVDYLGISESAFSMSVSRAQNKQIIAQPKSGFFVIVPVEYQLAGCPPASWFIDDLMLHLGALYYVALLSAAALYGAGHQQPQVFQVITNQRIDDVKIGRVYIKFIFKSKWPKFWHHNKKTYTGYMQVSTSEGVIIDLLKYMQHSGYIDNISTVLSELSDELSKDKLKQYLDDDFVPLAHIQRFGYLLDFIEKDNLSECLYDFIKDKPLDYVLLVPGSYEEVITKNERWHINVNHEIELDI